MTLAILTKAACYKVKPGRSPFQKDNSAISIEACAVQQVSSEFEGSVPPSTWWPLLEWSKEPSSKHWKWLLYHSKLLTS